MISGLQGAHPFCEPPRYLAKRRFPITAREIAVVVSEGVQALDVAGPLDVFAAANGFLPENEQYQCFLVAKDTAPIRSSNGMTILPDLSYDMASRTFNTVLVAGGPTFPKRDADDVLSAWLRRWGTKAKRYGSICNGAFMLGHAGLLDGKTVTTHWLCSSDLTMRFPKANVEHDRIYARDGPLVTSAGVTAGIDLSLALVAEDHGPAICLACAKGLVVVAQRQGGQSQFSPLLLPPIEAGSPLEKVKAYVVEHMSEPYPVERLAKIAGVSRRSIARIFVRDFDMTPHDFVEGIRINRARNLLEATEMALKAIAFDCGFASADQMRSAFQRKLGITPIRYRESFRTCK